MSATPFRCTLFGSVNVSAYVPANLDGPAAGRRSRRDRRSDGGVLHAREVVGTTARRQVTDHVHDVRQAFVIGPMNDADPPMIFHSPVFRSEEISKNCPNGNFCVGRSR